MNPVSLTVRGPSAPFFSVYCCPAANVSYVRISKITLNPQSIRCCDDLPETFVFLKKHWPQRLGPVHHREVDKWKKSWDGLLRFSNCNG
jgi:hypothetical protein